MRAKIVLGLASRFPSGRKSNAERARLALARAAQVPEWPRNGYAGSLRARELEAEERRFIRELAAPVDLEAKLLQAANYERLPGRQAEAVLTAFAQGRQQHVDERLAVFAQAEGMFRPPGDDAAMAARLARLRFEADAYLGRLNAAKLMLVLRLDERERRDYERAYAVTKAVVAGRDVAAELRANQPPPEPWPRKLGR